VAHQGYSDFLPFDKNGTWDHVGILKSKELLTFKMSVYEGNTSYTASKDPVEIKKANANGGEYLLRPDRKHSKYVKIVRPNALTASL